MIVWKSAGAVGFKGSRKSTPFAAQVTADAAAREGMEHGLQKVEVFVKGPGSGRETAIRSLQADHDNLTGKVLRLPDRVDIDTPVQEQLIVELYSK